MTQSPIETAADYAEAMLIARGAKVLLCLITALMLLTQLGIFFWAHFSQHRSDPANSLCKYLTDGIDFLGVLTPLVLAVDLLLIAGIMLVGRLIGVSHVVSAFLWCVVLIVLLFPWQAFLINQIPGVLYTWAELVGGQSRTATATRPQFFFSVLFWARFVGWPVVALLILLSIQLKSRRGMRLALGEASPRPIQPSTSGQV